MSKHIYADNAATTQLSHKAYDIMSRYLLMDYGNASQLYSFARSPQKAIKEARTIIASCIGALPEEIYFTSCGTESNNWVVNGAIQQNMPIITSCIEHHAILKPCEYAQSIGHPVSYLTVDELGLVHSDALCRELENKRELVSIIFANNEIGTIQSVQELVNISHSKDAIFHTDAIQAVGHVPINVKELGVDMLSASAHKFNGPKGIGFLYIKKGLKWPSFIMGGVQELGNRAGTENVASIIAMAIALKENVDIMQNNKQHLMHLEETLLKTLLLNGVDFKRNGAIDHVPGNISLSFCNKEGEMLLHRLDLLGISVSTGSACDSQNTKTSHVLKAIGLDEKYTKGTIRISFGRYNVVEDAFEIADKIASILAKSI
jgi:cysteine desulfurase